MKIELQKYYEARFEMFASEGWKDLMEDVKNMLEVTDTLDGTSPENLGFKQGEVSMMRWLLGLKDISEKAYSDLQYEDF